MFTSPLMRDCNHPSPSRSTPCPSATAWPDTIRASASGSWLYPLEFFDYDTVELIENVEYRILERAAMEEYFALRCANCRRIEAWGVPYHRAQPGLHQIHSRRRSASVPTDLRGRDGAVRFYFDEDQRVELVLLKFTGQ